MGRLPVVAGLLGLVLVSGVTWYALWLETQQTPRGPATVLAAERRDRGARAPLTLPRSRVPEVEPAGLATRAGLPPPEVRTVVPAHGRPDVAVSDVVARGRVDVDEDADTLVVLHDAMGEQRASTEPARDGAFTLHHARPLEAGWTVSAEVLDDARLAADTTPPQPAHHPGEPPLVCTLRPAPAPRLLGRVSDAVAGHPLGQADVAVVTALAAWRDLPDETETARDGSYEILLSSFPPRALYAWVHAEGYQARLHGPFDVLPGEARIEDFRLHPATPLRGRVVSARSGHGLPDADVVLTSRRLVLAEDQVLATTGADGGFVLDAAGIPLQQALLHVRGADHEPALVPVPAGPGPLEVALRAAYRVRGTVRDAVTGAPVPGVIVGIVPAFQWTWEDEVEADEAFTRADGSFETRPWLTPSDEAVVRVHTPGYLPYRARLETIGGPAGDVEGRVHTADVRLQPLH